MRTHLRLGRIAGIPVGVNATVLVIFVLVVGMVATQALPGAVHGYPKVAYWSVGVIVGACFFLSLLAHELAHAIVARRYGVATNQITLWMLGGIAELDGEPPTATADFRIAVAGPLTSLLAGAGFLTIAGVSAGTGAPRLIVASATWLGSINVLLAVFNLLPGAPLDGGRILRAVLWRRRGDRLSAALTADRTGRALGYALVLFGGFELLATRDFVGGLWLAMLGWFLVAAAAGEAQVTVQHSLLADVTVAAVMSRDPMCLVEYQSVAAAVRRVAEDPHTAYPVLSLDGTLAGLISSDQLARVPTAIRADVRVGKIMVPTARMATATPEMPLARALDATHGRLPIVVVDGGSVVGIVTAAETDRALRRAALVSQQRS